MLPLPKRHSEQNPCLELLAHVLFYYLYNILRDHCILAVLSTLGYDRLLDFTVFCGFHLCVYWPPKSHLSPSYLRLWSTNGRYLPTRYFSLL